MCPAQISALRRVFIASMEPCGGETGPDALAGRSVTEAVERGEHRGPFRLGSPWFGVDDPQQGRVRIGVAGCVDLDLNGRAGGVNRRALVTRFATPEAK